MKHRLMIHHFPRDYEDIGDYKECFREQVMAKMKEYGPEEDYEYDVAIGMKELKRKVP